MPNRFVRYQLRTTDVDAAHSFYRELLGDGFWRDGVDVGPLPARAAARGAPSHWLGYIGVDDVVGAELRFISHGATQLGPGLLRDPFGALVGLTSDANPPQDHPVARHLLHTRRGARVLAVRGSIWLVSG